MVAEGQEIEVVDLALSELKTIDSSSEVKVIDHNLEVKVSEPNETGSPVTKEKRRRNKPKAERAARPAKEVPEPRNVVEPEVDVKTVLDNIPQGNYKVISFAVDLTGKKTTDEICQIAAFAPPSEAYNQYVMPSCDVTIGGTKSHGVRVFVMFGKYRVLRNVWSRKILKTKSIFSTLNEFLDWLKQQKESSDGIILAYHDHNRVNVPFFLNKAVQSFKMVEEFGQLIKGVVNCADLPFEPESAPAGKENKRRSNTFYSRIRESGFEPDMDKDKLKTHLQSAKIRAEFTYKLHAKMFDCKENADILFDDIKKALYAGVATTATAAAVEKNSEA